MSTTTQVPARESPDLAELLRQTQAQLAALTMAVASGKGEAYLAQANSSPAAVGVDDAMAHLPPSAATVEQPTTSHQGSGVIGTTVNSMPNNHPTPSVAGPLQAMAPSELPPTATTSSSDVCIELGNGTELCVSKQDVPDPPAVTFAKDIPLLMRTWDDTSPGWSPSEAALRIEEEPIAVKYWQRLYCYGKSGQWGGLKKSWFQWKVSVQPHFFPKMPLTIWCIEDIAESWQQLTEAGFWHKFSNDQGHMSFTAICDVLKEERQAADSQLADRARLEYGGKFNETFSYRRGSKRYVTSSNAGVARRYRTLQTK